MAKLSRRVRKDGPKVPRWLLIALALICVLLLALDFTGLRYGYLDYEKKWGGYALTAFAAALAALVLAALLRPVLVRRDDLYGESDD